MVRRPESALVATVIGGLHTAMVGFSGFGLTIGAVLASVMAHPIWPSVLAVLPVVAGSVAALLDRHTWTHRSRGAIGRAWFSALVCIPSTVVAPAVMALGGVTSPPAPIALIWAVGGAAVGALGCAGLASLLELRRFPDRQFPEEVHEISEFLDFPRPILRAQLLIAATFLSSVGAALIWRPVEGPPFPPVFGLLSLAPYSFAALAAVAYVVAAALNREKLPHPRLWRDTGWAAAVIGFMLAGVAVGLAAWQYSVLELQSSLVGGVTLLGAAVLGIVANVLRAGGDRGRRDRGVPQSDGGIHDGQNNGSHRWNLQHLQFERSEPHSPLSL